MSRPKTVMNHGIPAAGSCAIPALPPRMRSAARSETERSYECLSGSQVVSSSGTRSCQAGSESRTRASRRRAPRPSVAPRGRGRRVGQLPAPARRELDPVADGAAVDLPSSEKATWVRARLLRRSSRTSRSPSSRVSTGVGERLGARRVAEREVVLLDREDVREVVRHLDRELERDRLPGHVLDRDPLLHRVRDEALPDDRDRVLRETVGQRVAKVERRRGVLDLAGGEQERRLAVHGQPEEREVPGVLGEEAAGLLGDVAALVADAEGRSLEDRERHHLILVPEDPPAARLGQRLDDDLVDVDVQRSRQREEDAVGDVLGGERLDALVDGGRLLLVALEADERELGAACEPGRERGDADRPAEQVLAERLAEHRSRRLDRAVHGRVLVRGRPAIESMVTMCPPSRMCGRQRRVIRMTPVTFVSIIHSSSSSLDSVNG